MKLYDSIGPNPQCIRIVLREKGVTLPKQRINLRDAENRQPPYLAINPMGQMPALELDDGTVLTEITAIAEYLEELYPNPPLIGVTPEQRAQTRMWVRRLDLNIFEPLTAGYRYGEGLAMFQDRTLCIPEASAGMKAQARHWLQWLDGQLAGRATVTGDRFTLADIMLYCFMTFAAIVGQPPDPAWRNLARWHAETAQRPSIAG